MNKLLLIALLPLFLLSCKTKQKVTERTSLQKVFRTDTVRQSDSVFIIQKEREHMKGDTIFVERYIYKYVQKDRDSKARLDTIMDASTFEIIDDMAKRYDNAVKHNVAAFIIVLCLGVAVLWLHFKR